MEVLWRHIDQTWPHWLEAAQQTAVPASPVRSGSNSEVFASWDYWRPQTSLPCVASQTKRTWMNLEYAQISTQIWPIPTYPNHFISPGFWALKLVEICGDDSWVPDITRLYFYTVSVERETNHDQPMSWIHQLRVFSLLRCNQCNLFRHPSSSSLLHSFKHIPWGMWSKV